ncbi:hypothetical protein PV726_44935 [Streptomyces europaeiscabiei]|uniref:hypothetical protein n=1 Tax=Streptomyces europaeiscabiei TaxID=146819 RepID=UPI0029A22D27|nr:hypothetical protein [Streptomyces europaeiscabiei]MDX3697236.1 hypothetical protein [Streptomyces europaeiscabiei]
MQSQHEQREPQVTAEPAPPYDSDKQRRPGLEADMRTAPRYRRAGTGPPENSGTRSR